VNGVSLGDNRLDSRFQLAYIGFRDAVRPKLAAYALLSVPVLIAVVALLAPALPLRSPYQVNLSQALSGPSSAHWLGTDEVGRDLLSRLVWGTRTTLLAALTATVVAGCIGVPLGMLSAYRRGFVDGVLNRLADAVLTIPALVLLLAAEAALQSNIYTSMVILGVVTSPQVYRVVRAAALAVSQRAFVQAAKLSGCGQVRILAKYILPNIREQITVQLTYLLGFGMLVESGISFLGVGVKAPNPSLGTLLSEGETLIGRDIWIVLLSGVVLSILILACNFAGDLFSVGVSDE
jgi:peptide/nickel transport system permease protein